ncbi:hypothetical protein [Microbacterium lacticum]
MHGVRPHALTIRACAGRGREHGDPPGVVDRIGRGGVVGVEEQQVDAPERALVDSRDRTRVRIRPPCTLLTRRFRGVRLSVLRVAGVRGASAGGGEPDPSLVVGWAHERATGGSPDLPDLRRTA